MPRNRLRVGPMYSMAPVACKNWHPDTTRGTYLPPNTREASYAIFPIAQAALITIIESHSLLNMPKRHDNCSFILTGIIDSLLCAIESLL